MPINGNTNGQVVVMPTSDGKAFPLVQSAAGVAGYPAAGPIKGATIPYWSTGTGIPTFQAPYGSLYTNLAAAVGSNILYCFKPNTIGPGTWHGII